VLLKLGAHASLQRNFSLTLHLLESETKMISSPFKVSVTFEMEETDGLKVLSKMCECKYP